MLLMVVRDLTNYVESMALLICVVAYFVNVSGIFYLFCRFLDFCIYFRLFLVCQLHCIV